MFLRTVKGGCALWRVLMKQENSLASVDCAVFCIPVKEHISFEEQVLNYSEPDFSVL